MCFPSFLAKRAALASGGVLWPARNHDLSRWLPVALAVSCAGGRMELAAEQAKQGATTVMRVPDARPRRSSLPKPQFVLHGRARQVDGAAPAGKAPLAGRLLRFRPPG